ncbi:TolC family protein [Bacteroides graminisolvens]|uniref:TolC family protein n=1 Tax=Bacteroides graminisolvens TaxID=477666 RepID=UPI0029C84433|nr:TolC family protein [Bacteroides graminisolvens]
MKQFVFWILIGCFAAPSQAQITLESCRQKAQANYPLVKQYELIEKTKEFSVSNAAKGYLPQFSLSAKATYQSDATTIDLKIGDFALNRVAPKDQYQAMVELNQHIWDGGNIHSQKELAKANSDVDREKLNVDMYALIERVNDLYFGILMLDEQLTQNTLLLDDLERTHKQISAYVANGVANSADLDEVKVEQLNALQKRTELKSSREAYVKMLSVFTGEEITETALFAKPVETVAPLTDPTDFRRPELSWFEAQNGRLDVNEQMLQARNMPRLGLFVQGAYGNPGLNMLKDKFETYYIAGVKLSWNFGGLYTLKNDKKQIQVNRAQLDSNRDVFLFNTRLQATQQNSAINSVRALLDKDDEIIALRTNIRKAAEAKVSNGTLAVTDLLREINSENKARQVKALHEVQLLMNIYQLKYTTNN